MYDRYNRRDDHPDHGADSVTRREAEALQKAAAAEAHCELLQELVQSGRVNPAGPVASPARQPSKAKMGKEPPVFDGTLPATDVMPWLQTVNNYFRLNKATIELEQWPAVGRTFLNGAAARSMDSAQLSTPAGLTWQQFEHDFNL